MKTITKLTGIIALVLAGFLALNVGLASADDDEVGIGEIVDVVVDIDPCLLVDCDGPQPMERMDDELCITVDCTPIDPCIFIDCDNPAVEPPADQPPADPPADQPPADPPADQPPADPPADQPPADQPPADQPPADPPADQPPASQPQDCGNDCGQSDVQGSTLPKAGTGSAETAEESQGGMLLIGLIAVGLLVAFLLVIAIWRMKPAAR